jgi:hypothetical protein
VHLLASSGLPLNSSQYLPLRRVFRHNPFHCGVD